MPNGRRICRRRVVLALLDQNDRRVRGAGVHVLVADVAPGAVVDELAVQLGVASVRRTAVRIDALQVVRCVDALAGPVAGVDGAADVVVLARRALGHRRPGIRLGLRIAAQAITAAFFQGAVLVARLVDHAVIRRQLGRADALAVARICRALDAIAVALGADAGVAPLLLTLGRVADQAALGAGVVLLGAGLAVDDAEASVGHGLAGAGVAGVQGALQVIGLAGGLVVVVLAVLERIAAVVGAFIAVVAVGLGVRAEDAALSLHAGVVGALDLVVAEVVGGLALVVAFALAVAGLDRAGDAVATNACRRLRQRGHSAAELFGITDADTASRVFRAAGTVVRRGHAVPHSVAGVLRANDIVGLAGSVGCRGAPTGLAARRIAPLALVARIERLVCIAAAVLCCGNEAEAGCNPGQLARSIGA